MTPKPPDACSSVWLGWQWCSRTLPAAYFWRPASRRLSVLSSPQKARQDELYGVVAVAVVCLHLAVRSSPSTWFFL